MLYTANALTEKQFILDIILAVNKFLPYVGTNFGDSLAIPFEFYAKASSTETIELTIQGEFNYIYYYVYKTPVPAKPTPAEKAQINNIWIGLGYPEKIVL